MEFLILFFFLVLLVPNIGELVRRFIWWKRTEYQVNIQSEKRKKIHKINWARAKDDQNGCIIVPCDLMIKHDDCPLLIETVKKAAQTHFDFRSCEVETITENLVIAPPSPHLRPGLSALCLPVIYHITGLKIYEGGKE